MQLDSPYYHPSAVDVGETSVMPGWLARGMEFPYRLNRLNVAVSRARCVAVVIGSPRLFQVECKTPRQIELANAFCRYLEMAIPA